MESFKIIVACVLAAVVYGIVHDQFTARLCIEYFTVFHPTIVHTQSPTLLAFIWGVIATWWVGGILGVVLAISSRAGSRPKLQVRDLKRPLSILLVTMAASATVAGMLGWLFVGVPQDIAALVSPSAQRRFAADWWAHNASYLVGFTGGLALCCVAYAKRVKMGAAAESESTRFSFPVLAKVGAAFVVTGVLALGGWAVWSGTRTWVPVLMPISLSVGHIRTPEFKINQNAFYTVEVEAERIIPFETLNCLLGVEGFYPERCKDTPSLINASWKLTSRGVVVAHGSTDEFKGGAWSNTIAREIGTFNLEKGKRYVLDVDVLTDGSRLDAAHPRLKVGVHPEYYEGNMVMSLLVTLVAAVCMGIGFLLLLVGFVRRRRSSRSSISVA